METKEPNQEADFEGSAETGGTGGNDRSFPDIEIIELGHNFSA